MSLQLWRTPAATGRTWCGARTNAVLPAGERLGDGSYLGQIVAAGDHCHASAPVTVRVVECGLDDPAAPRL